MFTRPGDVCAYLHIEQGSKSDHKWSLETHVETHDNTRCELKGVELPTCDQVTQDGC